jgi:hypothetical protein
VHGGFYAELIYHCAMDFFDPIRAQLTSAGWRMTDQAVNDAGRHVCLLTHTNGCAVAMFFSDVHDLAKRRASLDQIIARNKGADLADPWPVGIVTSR